MAILLQVLGNLYVKIIVITKVIGKEESGMERFVCPDSVCSWRSEPHLIQFSGNTVIPKGR